MKVKKRDGRIVEFDSQKVKRAIQYAAQAVERKEDDFQNHKEEFEEIVQGLTETGYSLDEAREIAEDRIVGYILNGVYTEFDPDEADKVVDIVVETLEDTGDEIVEAEFIQEVIEKALIMTEHVNTAREYIAWRTQRDKVRDMNGKLMKCFEGLTFKNSIANDTKRENANVDGDSAMGTMLKYGSESAKEFNLLHLVSPDIADAHRDGDIHIHDLDFMGLTETCLVGDTSIKIKENGVEKDINAEYFDRYLRDFPDSTVFMLENTEIMSNGKFTRLKNCVRHSSKGKRVLKIETETGSLSVTDDHVIPISVDNQWVDTKAKDIKIGDKLIGVGKSDTACKITSISEIDYSGYVYDFETDTHYFDANEYVVHNCVQIDLLKLFRGGFSTGHGILREPGEIRSAAALACIGLQSSQNDMHSVS